MSVTTTPITVPSNYFGELGWMAWMGPNAQVDPHSMRVERPTTLRSSIGGFTTGIQSPRSHRQWSVDVPPCQPSDLAPVLAYIDGEFGQGPWWWVPEDAARSNLLPPRTGTLDTDAMPWITADKATAATQGGPVRLALDTAPGGQVIAGRSLVIPSSSVWTVARDTDGTSLYLPVVPGVPVTFSAWLSDPSMQLRIQTRNANNTTIATTATNAPADATPSLLARASVTIPPVGENVRYIVIGVLGAGGRMARPAVTWTARMVDYGAASGCPYATINADDVQQDVNILLDQNCPPIPGRWPYATSASYTITEVA